jgi:uncharacterized coiled-coil protein SlyX
VLKTRNDVLEKQITELKKQSPDALVESLSRRVAVTKKEIEALNLDSDKHQNEIEIKERNLSELSDKLSSLQEILKQNDLLCPKCSAPLSKRDWFTIHGYINDREVEADVGYTEYECGYSIREDQIQPTSPCGSAGH